MVLFGHTWSNSRSSKYKTTAATLYKEYVAKERKAYNAYNKKMKEAKEKKKTLNLRKVNKVKLFSQLTKDEKAVFQKRAEEEINFNYFVIGQCTRVPAASAPSSSARGPSLSRKSKILESAELNLSYIKQGDIPAILTLFDTRNLNLEDALQIQQASEEGKYAVLEVSWNCLLTNSWWMSEHDVAVSKCMNPMPTKCSKCPNVNDLCYCDGSVFPGRGPTAFPCDRALICNDCRPLYLYRENSEGGAAFVPQKDIWRCDDCLKTPRTFEGLFGYVTPPRDNPRCRSVSFPARDSITGRRVQTCLPVRSPGAPVLEFGTDHNPARDYAQYVQRIQNAPEPTFVQSVQKSAAIALLDTFGDAGLSAGQMTSVLKGLKKMKEKALIKTDLPIFAKVETLKKWSGREDGDVFGSIPETYFIDISALGQGETEVAVNMLNPLLAIQRLLLKETIPRSALYIGDGQVLTFEDGEPAVGGEYFENIFYRSRCKEFPLENVKLLVISSSDKMLACGQTSYPLYLQNGNVRRAFATEATTLLSFLPVIPKRLPHGGDEERFTREQSETYNQVCNDAVALVLKKFEEANLQGGVMLLYPDGIERKTNFICASIAEDMEGKFDKCLISVNSCPRCWIQNKHFGSWLPMHACGCSPLGFRTPAQTFQFLFACFMNQAVKGLSKETDERAASLGMRHYKVVNQLLAFSTFFGEGGVYSVMNYDDLHSMYLGLFVLILSGADILFRKFFKETRFMSSYEDAHNKVETILKYLQGMNDGVHILKPMRLGWYRKRAWNGVEYQCFMQHILFVFGTHDALISDRPTRLAFVEIIKNTHSLYVRMKMKSSWREREIKQLREDISTILWDLQRLFNTEVDLTVDDRTPEETFSFIGPLPAKKPKTTISGPTSKKGRNEDVSSDSDSGSDDLSDSTSSTEDSEDESNECFTLKGNQTRIPKVHAATTIPDCIVNHGNGAIGATGMFECMHRRGKRCIKHSNRIQSQTLQGQVLLSSVTEASETAPRPVRTERARLFYEEHMGSPQSVEILSEGDSSEEEVARPFVHVGAGNKFIYI